MWRYPVLLLGDIKVVQAVPLPPHATYIPRNGIFVSLADAGITDLGAASEDSLLIEAQPNVSICRYADSTSLLESCSHGWSLSFVFTLFVCKVKVL